LFAIYESFSFDLSREVVGVSLNLFDRYVATLETRCDGNLALLTSLTTLYIAMKLHDSKKVKLDLLATLSRGQFGPGDIHAMEWSVLSALDWKVHPPTQYAFIAHFLAFLPSETNFSVRKELNEQSRYLCELSVCDSYFVGSNSSTVAFAAILNVMADMNFSKFSGGLREKFLRDIHNEVGISYYSESVVNARQRLRQMFVTTSGDESPTSVVQGNTQYENGSYNNINPWDGHENSGGGDCKSVTTIGSVGSSNHLSCVNHRSRTNSVDSKGSNRFSPNPRRRCLAVSPMAASTSRAHKSCSPLA
jgi:Cyclin, N-terminal domain/Cyclin, C-terminal domain